MLNSNDLFNQIGLIVDPQNNFSYQSINQYKTFLEIELGEGESYVLQIRQNDDPYQLAAKFCKKHQLNQLAVQIVQKKIVQAKQREQEKLQMNKTRSKNSRHNNLNQTKSLMRNSVSPAKSNLSKSPIKNKTPLKNKIKQNYQISNVKTKTDVRNRGIQASQNLYFKGIISSKVQEQKRVKLIQQQQKKQCQQLTFKPKINTVSQKIIEFRRQTGTTRPKQKKANPADKLYQDLRQCTFQPAINKVSNLIVKNKGSYNNEYQHFNQLFKNQKPNKRKLIEKEQKQYFRPHLNTKSIQKIKQPFFVRLEKALQLKKNNKDNDYQQYSFKPKVGRGPLQKKNKQNVPVWEYLNNISKQTKQQTSFIDSELNQSKAISKVSSSAHYQNLIEKRVTQIFSLLDSDNDGVISPQNAAIQKLSRGSLIFLKPIFDEMDELNAQLLYNQFKKAVINLLNDSDPHKKGVFLAQRQKKQNNDCSFSPIINKKSRDLMQCRSVSNIHKELYQQGLKERQKKQYMLQKQRAKRQEDELMQCSFKPCINNNNFYNSKVLAQKISGMQALDSFQNSH